MSKLIELLDYGQSYWLDNLSRKKIDSGELKKRVSEQGLRGITSNPSIFNEAISNGSEYNDIIKDLVLKGHTLQEIYDALTIKDVQDACDILEPVYKQSGGFDGFVSLEVRPSLARDTEGTIEEVRRLHKAVGRKNCMIKIPGTAQGLPAIEQMLYEGININITLLFSLERYAEVVEAYIKALKRRLKENKDISQVISVASFFLSRIDTLTDKILSQYIIHSKTKKTFNPENLFGSVGTASAILAYHHFTGVFESADWQKLKKQGAHVQRVLWASTSNKDPLYPDLRYVEPLIGPNTINTLPDKTITEFAKHGHLKKHAIQDGLLEASHVLENLNKMNIKINMITQQLENEGVQKFTDDYQKLMSNLALKRLKILENSGFQQKAEVGGLDSELKLLCASLDEKQVTQRLFQKDTSLWKTDKDDVKTISEGLGWLSLPEDMYRIADKFMKFAEEIKKEGYESTVLLGMGGSSLCSEVARETFGSAKGYPKLYVLDNTEPEAIRNLESKIDIEKTLFIVASKSGSTLETECFFRYFHKALTDKVGSKAGRNFIAITDEGTSLVKQAAKYKFRKTFINLPNVGGRYSVLSDFGIVPMALVGIDVKALLKNARQVMIGCGPEVPANVNPAVMMGAILGLAQRKGRDKVTFVLSSSLESFGYWVEQLLAESTGKEGKGLIPVNGEKLGAPEIYGDDRIFIHMYLATDEYQANVKKLKALEAAGHPVVNIGIKEKIELGGAYYHWEIATAVAGIVMGINPFDQPNVTESKKNTNNILDEWIKDGAFKKSSAILNEGEIELFAGKKVKEAIKKHTTSLEESIDSFLALAKKHDYIALLPYFELTPYRTELLQSWREKMKGELKEATTLLNGPRYLHSTGQLHKGGPDSGLYIILTSEEECDLPIPGQKYDFATLHQAQALGDCRSLDDKGRRVIRINLGQNIDESLANICRSVSLEA